MERGRLWRAWEPGQLRRQQDLHKQVLNFDQNVLRKLAIVSWSGGLHPATKRNARFSWVAFSILRELNTPLA